MGSGQPAFGRPSLAKRLAWCSVATIRDVAKAAGVSTATVSAVLNETAYVSPKLRARVLAAVSQLNYTPSLAAQTLKHGRSQLIALVVSDLANPFFARIVCAAEGNAIPMVLFGRVVEDEHFDTVTIDNVSAARQVTNYLLDLGHRRIGTITGPLHLTTGRGRLDGMLQAMAARGLAPYPSNVRSGEFREEVAYSVAREIIDRPDRPTALYVANGVMALGVMRALADLGLKCPDDISIASTDTIPGIGGLRPRLTRSEHPIAEMTNEALRLLVDRITRDSHAPPRHVVFQPALVLGESCAPVGQDRRPLAA